MNQTTQETEIKLYTPDLQIIQNRLTDAGAALIYPRIFERNMRYENADKSLHEQGIVVRLREDSRIRLTYKGPGEVNNNDVISREELEVEVSDFATMEMILSRLGYQPYMAYEKYRTTYELNDTEIVLDELPFGNFTEIEGTPDQIEATIEALSLADMLRLPYSYARLFDFVKYNMGLIFRDLTFENFEGITVNRYDFRPFQNT